MSNAIFLLVAVGGSIIGSVILWLRQRKPRNTMTSIEEFQREMDALGSDRPSWADPNQRPAKSERRSRQGPSRGRRSPGNDG